MKTEDNNKKQSLIQYIIESHIFFVQRSKEYMKEEIGLGLFYYLYYPIAYIKFMYYIIKSYRDNKL